MWPNVTMNGASTKQTRTALSRLSDSQESVIGKQITLPEALCISRDISEQAERRRLLAAEWKAERGIQWKDLTYTSNTDGGWLTNEIAERRQ